jgi:hypothetical protein
LDSLTAQDVDHPPARRARSAHILEPEETPDRDLGAEPDDEDLAVAEPPEPKQVEQQNPQNSAQ